jgi:hypothetical protein
MKGCTMRRLIALLSLLGVCGLASQASAVVLISVDETYAQVSNGSSEDTANLVNTGGTVAIATLPGYLSTTTSNFSTAGDSAVFSGGFVHARQGDQFGSAYGFVAALFTTDTDVTYSARGTYSSSDGDSGLVSYLYDNTTSISLYSSYQESFYGPAAFNLGGTAGNYGNAFSGSLTGTLLAGHSYTWLGAASTGGYPVSDLGAAAGGNVSLTIGEAAVPEASSVIVWSLLAVTIGGACWWRQSSLAA